MDALKQNSSPVEKQTYKKREIYVVGFGMNTGSEINGNRPALIFKANPSTYGDDVVVVPLTSAGKERKGDAFDVFVHKDGVNKLFQPSFARLRQIKAVSVKRIGKRVGHIGSEAEQKAITEGVKKMLGIDG